MAPTRFTTTLTLIITTLGAVLYGIGLVQPMATIQTKFAPFIDRTSSYSLVQTIRNLYREDEFILGTILVLFTFVFPATKFFSLFMGLWAGWRPHNSRLYRWMRNTGRWSMLDVLVVAILVVLLRVKTLGGGMSMQPEIGIYCFGASVLLAMWAGERIDRTELGDEAAVAEAEADTDTEASEEAPATGRVSREPA